MPDPVLHVREVQTACHPVKSRLTIGALVLCLVLTLMVPESEVAGQLLIPLLAGIRSRRSLSAVTRR